MCRSRGTAFDDADVLVEAEDGAGKYFLQMSHNGATKNVGEKLISLLFPSYFKIFL
jgi:hypothetical protein